MHAEALHHAEAPRNGAVGHDPHDHMHGFRREGDEVPKGVVGGGGLRNFIIGLRFEGMDQIWKLDRVLNKKDGNVVPYQIPDSIRRVELRRETPRIARAIGRSSKAVHGGETDEHRSLDRRVLKDRCFGMPAQ